MQRGGTYGQFEDDNPAEHDYAEAVEILTALEQQGVVQGTDLKTLADARSELMRLRRTEGTIPE